MEEIWKPIPEYEGLYEVSNKGRMKSYYNGYERLLKLHRNRLGYYIVRLPENGVFKYRLLHRLIALTFIPNPENKPEVDHIDRNPSNNCVENLRWVTHKENMNNPNTIKNMSKSQSNYEVKVKKRLNNSQSKPVDMLSIDGKYIRSFDSINQAANFVGIAPCAIRRCCKGTQHSSLNYRWRFSV